MIWDHARANGFEIVPKDSDFSDRSLLLGRPPEVIRLHLANCTAQAVEALLRTHFPVVTAFERESDRSCLHLPLAEWHQ